MLNRDEWTVALQNNPEVIAKMIIINDTNNATQSNSSTTSWSSYTTVEYIKRLSGSIATEKIVETAVIATESAKSALKREHHLRNGNKKSCWADPIAQRKRMVRCRETVSPWQSIYLYLPVAVATSGWAGNDQKSDP